MSIFDAQGWAAQLVPEPVVSKSFVLVDITWEVVAYWESPCCGERVALVRRVGSGLTEWQGLECPKKCTTTTWAVDNA